MTRTAVLFVALLALASCGSAATYATVTQAAKSIPELSVLATNLERTTALTTTFSDLAFVGTVFVPTNDALAALSDQVRAAQRPRPATPRAVVMQQRPRRPRAL